jgi:hypothetical protein
MNVEDNFSVTGIVRPGVLVSAAVLERGLVFVPGWVEYIARGWLSIDAYYAKELSMLFVGTSSELWLSIQECYDLSIVDLYPPNLADCYRVSTDESYRASYQAVWSNRLLVLSSLRSIVAYYKFKNEYCRLCPIETGFVEGIGFVVDIGKQQRGLEWPVVIEM